MKAIQCIMHRMYVVRRLGEGRKSTSRKTKASPVGRRPKCGRDRQRNVRISRSMIWLGGGGHLGLGKQVDERWVSRSVKRCRNFVMPGIKNAGNRVKEGGCVGGFLLKVFKKNQASREKETAREPKTD